MQYNAGSLACPSGSSYTTDRRWFAIFTILVTISLLPKHTHPLSCWCRPEESRDDAASNTSCDKVSFSHSTLGLAHFVIVPAIAKAGLLSLTIVLAIVATLLDIAVFLIVGIVHALDRISDVVFNGIIQ